MLLRHKDLHWRQVQLLQCLGSVQLPQQVRGLMLRLLQLGQPCKSVMPACSANHVFMTMLLHARQAPHCEVVTGMKRMHIYAYEHMKRTYI